jgi:nitrate reductase gamma subunit
MTLLDFARGPGFQIALVIMIIGIVWRALGALMVRYRKNLSQARNPRSMIGGVKAVITYSAPPHELEKNIKFQHYTGYVWHIGFFVTLLFYGPHIMFFENIIGFGWPALPNAVIGITGILTMAILVTLLIRRMIHPVLRVLNNVDDYISWLVTFLPLLTGMLAFGHISVFGLIRYETMLALHILSVEVLMIWLPFGKLMHMVMVWPSRYKTGAAFSRRGVEA